MESPETNGGHEVDDRGRRPRWRAPSPGRSPWRFATAVASAWALFVAAIGVVALFVTSGDEQPSWGEVAASTLSNFAFAFVAALALSLIVRAWDRRVGAGREPTEAGADDDVRSGRPEGRSWRGHPVVPTTTEGRVALGAALLAFVPYIAGPAMLVAPIFLVLAVRRGDRALLLLLPLLVGLFLVVLLVAELAVGHD